MPPSGPQPEDLRRLMAAAPVGRRAFLRGAGLVGLGLGAPSLLSACGTKAAQQTAESCVSKDLSSSEKTFCPGTGCGIMMRSANAPGRP